VTLFNWLPRQCVANAHKWTALCACGKARVCRRCGVGEGAIPCACGRANEGFKLKAVV